MTVNRYATQAGKRFETELMKHFRENDYDVERLRLTGEEDEGDLVWRLPNADRVVIEAKREKGFNLAGWVKEAEAEAENYRNHRGLKSPVGFVVVHYARGKNISRSYVTTPLYEWIAQVAP